MLYRFHCLTIQYIINCRTIQHTIYNIHNKKATWISPMYCTSIRIYTFNNQQTTPLLIILFPLSCRLPIRYIINCTRHGIYIYIYYDKATGVYSSMTAWQTNCTNIYIYIYINILVTTTTNKFAIAWNTY